MEISRPTVQAAVNSNHRSRSMRDGFASSSRLFLVNLGNRSNEESIYGQKNGNGVAAEMAATAESSALLPEPRHRAGAR